jgi:flagellar motor protein MotB
MCDPVSAAMAFSAVASHAAQAQQAKLTNQRNAKARLQITNARDNSIRQQALKESQEKAQLAQKKMDSNIEAMELTSRASLSAGEAGVAGRVVDAIMTKYERDRLTTNTNISADIETVGTQGMYDRAGIESDAQSRLNQYQPVQGPNPLLLAAGLANAGANAYTVANKPPTT